MYRNGKNGKHIEKTKELIRNSDYHKNHKGYHLTESHKKNIAQSKIGSAGAGTIAERPETFGLMVILVAIPETLVILGFVVAAMIMIMLV